MPNFGETVTSAQNKYVSLARALGDRKQRQKSSLYRFDGVKLFCEALTRGVEIDFLIFSEGSANAVLKKAESLYGVSRDMICCKAISVADSLFERISEESAPEGIITVARYDKERHREIPSSELTSDISEKILLLEELRDPQNVGAILRTAAAFAVDRVIMGRDCADIYNSKTIRASMGAVFSMKIDRVDKISEAVKTLRAGGRRVFAAALDERAERLGKTEFSSADAVVIGNEGHGLSEDTILASDSSVYIPMSSGVESLNAAVAASVLMWEFFGKK